MGTQNFFYCSTLVTRRKTSFSVIVAVIRNIRHAWNLFVSLLGILWRSPSFTRAGVIRFCFWSSNTQTKSVYLKDELSYHVIKSGWIPYDQIRHTSATIAVSLSKPSEDPRHYLTTQAGYELLQKEKPQVIVYFYNVYRQTFMPWTWRNVSSTWRYSHSHMWPTNTQQQIKQLKNS